MSLQFSSYSKMAEDIYFCQSVCQNINHWHICRFPAAVGFPCIHAFMCECCDMIDIFKFHPEACLTLKYAYFMQNTLMYFISCQNVKESQYTVTLPIKKYNLYF